MTARLVLLPLQRRAGLTLSSARRVSIAASAGFSTSIAPSTQAAAATMTTPTPIPEWASPQARAAVHGLWERFDLSASTSSTPTAKPATDIVQTLDANQLGLLRVLVEPMVPIPSLDTDQDGTSFPMLEQGTPLLPTEHLVYFTPRTPLRALSPDGSDPSFNPPGPHFTRRMWAGGQLDFGIHPHHPARRGGLCVGDQVRERTFVEDVLVKQLGSARRPQQEASQTASKGDEEMLVVWVRKEYEVGGEVVLCDRRSWVFRPPLKLHPVPTTSTSAAATSPSTSTSSPPPTPNTPTIALTHPHAALVRFSALTYNAHRIHLDTLWAREVEGHRDVVVHGPLNLILLSRFWLALANGVDGDKERDGQSTGTRRRARGSRTIKSISYRAKSPICAHEPYHLVQLDEPVLEADGRVYDVVRAVKSDGGQTVIMEALIEGVDVDT